MMWHCLSEGIYQNYHFCIPNIAYDRNGVGPFCYITNQYHQSFAELSLDIVDICQEWVVNIGYAFGFFGNINIYIHMCFALRLGPPVS